MCNSKKEKKNLKFVIFFATINQNVYWYDIFKTILNLVQNKLLGVVAIALT
jgi:hypothetical protein